MPPDLALLSTLIGSNYPCFELIFMVQKVFEPLKFGCIGVDPTDCKQRLLCRIALPSNIVTLKCLSLGTPNTTIFPSVPNGKRWLLGVPIFEDIIIRL